jgi:hypothetical protein
MKEALNNWHRFAETGESKILDSLLDEHVVFHSPIVHTPQNGKQLTQMYLMSAHHVFSNNGFTYTREIITDTDWMLEFTATIDGVVINGVDIIKLNNEGKIIDFKVMLRPLKAVNMMHQKMMEMLNKFIDK